MHFVHLVSFLAQTTGPSITSAPPSATTQPVPGWAQLVQNPMFPILILLGIFIFISTRSKNSQEKQRKQMLEQLKKGDKVQTIGGILGTVIEARDNEVVVKVDETTNAKMRFTRNAIHRVIVEDEKAESKK